MNFPTHKIIGFLAVASTALFSSCDSNSSSSVEVVDLDVVLDTFITTAEAMPEVTAEEAESDSNIPLFVDMYTEQLNEGNLMKTPVGVLHVANDGSFLGFKDANANGAKDGGDLDLFKVEVYAEENKLVASDLVHSYRRDRGYSGGTFLAGYLVSRMMFGQGMAGITSNKFKNMKMSQPGYHKSAVSSVNKATPARSSTSARSSGGSKSFRSGK